MKKVIRSAMIAPNTRIHRGPRTVSEPASYAELDKLGKPIRAKMRELRDMIDQAPDNLLDYYDLETFYDELLESLRMMSDKM